MADSQSNIVTRFAPSPTGYLHIGGARTALYNWLFARHHGGKFLLRIEDTDQKRHSENAVQAILNGLKWMGLDWDDGVVSQFSRADQHAETARRLLKSGHAYRCFATKEELQIARDKAQAEGKTFKGDLWRDKDPSLASDGAPYTIRLKMDRDGSTIIHDKVQGRVEVSNQELDDMILLRSDGTPTYMLSVVVDDHDMAVTHIIRGDDHLNNTFRQAAIYKAMEWAEPEYAHIPLIHGPDGKKLSKRHGALAVESYAEMGFLPEAMQNYLLRLGWSHGDDEIISTQDAIKWFNLENVGSGPSRFDFDKLDYLNSHYLTQMDQALLLTKTVPLFEKALGRTLEGNETDNIKQAMPSLVERAKRLTHIVDNGLIFCHIRPLEMSDKAKKLLSEETSHMLFRLCEKLNSISRWDGETLKTAMHEFGDAENLKIGKIMQPVRAALTGGRPSGDLMEILEILGKDQSLARLKDQSVA